MRGGIRLYQVSEREYQCTMGLFKVLTMASATAAAVGLVGIVADQFISQESSALIKEITSYGQPASFMGGVMTLYFGLQYLMNKNLNKNRQATSEKQQMTSL